MLLGLDVLDIDVVGYCRLGSRCSWILMFLDLDVSGIDVLVIGFLDIEFLGS